MQAQGPKRKPVNYSSMNSSPDRTTTPNSSPAKSIEPPSVPPAAPSISPAKLTIPEERKTRKISTSGSIKSITSLFTSSRKETVPRLVKKENVNPRIPIEMNERNIGIMPRTVLSTRIENVQTRLADIRSEQQIEIQPPRGSNTEVEKPENTCVKEDIESLEKSLAVQSEYTKKLLSLLSSQGITPPPIPEDTEIEVKNALEELEKELVKIVGEAEKDIYVWESRLGGLCGDIQKELGEKKYEGEKVENSSIEKEIKPDSENVKSEEKAETSIENESSLAKALKKKSLKKIEVVKPAIETIFKKEDEPSEKVELSGKLDNEIKVPLDVVISHVDDQAMEVKEIKENKEEKIETDKTQVNSPKVDEIKSNTIPENEIPSQKPISEQKGVFADSAVEIPTLPQIFDLPQVSSTNDDFEKDVLNIFSAFNF